MRPLIGMIVVGGIIAIVLTSDHPIPLVRVTSGSMEPTLSAGDIAVVVPASITGPEAGDIGVFRQDGAWTTHRLQSVHDGMAVTAGDANVITDQAAGVDPVSTDAIAGVVPTVGGRPLAVGVPAVGHPLAVAAAGVTLIAMAPRDGPVVAGAKPRLATIAVLTAGTVVVAWFIGGTAVAAEGTTITNTGIFPSMVVGDGKASVVWPRATREVGTGQVTTVPGWAPAPVLEVTSAAGELVTVGAIAATSATAVTGLAALVRLGVHER